jgi:hypothetical protein
VNLTTQDIVPWLRVRGAIAQLLKECMSVTIDGVWIGNWIY